MTRTQAAASSYPELLAQDRWYMDPNGQVHRIRNMDLPDSLLALYRLLVMVDGEQHPAVHTPLYLKLAARSVSGLLGIPPQAAKRMVRRLQRDDEVMVLADPTSVFMGTPQSLLPFTAIAAEYLAKQGVDLFDHNPTAASAPVTEKPRPKP